MAYTSCSELWESEFDNIVSKRVKLQDINIDQLKLDVHDPFKKDEKNNELSSIQFRRRFNQR